MLSGRWRNGRAAIFAPRELSGPSTTLFLLKGVGCCPPTFAEQRRVRKGEQSQQAAPGRSSPWAMPSGYMGPGAHSWEAGQLQSLQVSLVYFPLGCPGQCGLLERTGLPGVLRRARGKGFNHIWAEW